jgi:hypothetical protein
MRIYKAACITVSKKDFKLIFQFFKKIINSIISFKINMNYSNVLLSEYFKSFEKLYIITKKTTL